jgi:hypothetical protein
MNTERCGTCRYYDRDNETTFDLESDEPLHPYDYEARCRRFPPAHESAEDHTKAGVLRDAYSGPVVQTIAWCGEWRQA